MFAILRNRDFGLLWFAGLISFSGDYALIIALSLHIYRLTGSASATAVAFAISYLPRVLLGPIAGVFIDRWDRKCTLVMTDLSRAVVLLPVLLVPDSLGMLYAVTAIHGTVGLFFAPAEGALLPALVGEDRLVAANALNALNNNLGMLFGPAMGALLYTEAGFSGVAAVDSATYIVSAVLIGLIAADARPKCDGGDATANEASPSKRMVTDLRAGLQVVRRDQALRVTFISTSLGTAADGVFLTLGFAPLVLDILGGSPAQVGWFGTVQAVGGLIAGIAVARIGHRIAVRWLLGGGLVGLGIADLGAFNAHRVAPVGTPAVGVAMGWMVLAGFPAVAGGAGRQAMVQTRAADAFRGRVFASLRATQGTAILIGIVVGGVLGDAVGIVPVLSVSAAVRIFGGLIALKFLPREESVGGRQFESETADRPATTGSTAP